MKSAWTLHLPYRQFGRAIGLRGIVVVAAWKRHIRRQFDAQRIAGEHILRHYADLEIMALAVVQIGVCRLVLQLDEDIKIGVDRDIPQTLEEVVTVAKLQLN